MLDNESVGVIQDTVDTVRKIAPFGIKIPEGQSLPQWSYLARGYLLQPVSRGQEALVSIVSTTCPYKCWKLDIAGIVFEDKQTDSRFQLKFYKDNKDWFTTDPISIADLTSKAFYDKLSGAATGYVQKKLIKTDLGHPVQSPHMVANDDLYPELPTGYKRGDSIDSLIGSWIFGIHKSVIPKDVKITVGLLFSLNSNPPVTLQGPSVMTIHEIADGPIDEYVVATDVMDVASPTPLRGGTKVVLANFGDVGWGIIAANPREYLFMTKQGNV